LDVDGRTRAAHAARVTLADLLASICVLALLVSATLVTLEQGQQAWAVGAARVEAQQSARAALTWLANEIRAAGQGIGASGHAAISVAEPTRLVLHVDKNLDGVVAVSSETIVWRLDRDILRRDTGGGGQPVINGVRALAFVYFDAAGAPTTDAAAVRTVRVSLSTRADHVRAASTAGLGATLSTEIRLRNR
jgi:type II secretory pathway component PulJ